ncbi:type II secretion system F family protein [Comamonas odontotermitis]|uniref:type II secretion system F family protein n=1 Tax=Comamonas odontotermitis TaxID=379895 RepID=UPI001CC6810B|nr:type II secretion system F family protein [Comamonas odontotermitis]UBB15697.1 type II secretion system F family protein [Comamonas odontotermitis]
MNSQQLWIMSLALASLAVGLMAAGLLWRMRRSSQAQAQVERILQTRQAGTAGTLPFPMPGLGAAPASANSRQDNETASVADSIRPPAWLETGIAKALLAEEDRKLLDQAGFDLARGGFFYVASRAILSICLPALVLLILQPAGLRALIYGFVAFALGLMLPKWIMRSKAAKRREQVVEELPLFVDLLRLLQGVGLSIDQSLQILASEFGSVLRVISVELTLANRLHSSGRTREQSLQRLSYLGADDDMSAVVNLLVQVDRHGGAVQEPLKEFSVRLREKRQASFKEKIGTITVKMTGVMVLTLLPALLVITAGPGFTAVIRSLSAMGGR